VDPAKMWVLHCFPSTEDANSYFLDHLHQPNYLCISHTCKELTSDVQPQIKEGMEKLLFSKEI
jgi:hypothetical protein